MRDRQLRLRELVGALTHRSRGGGRRNSCIVGTHVYGGQGESRWRCLTPVMLRSGDLLRAHIVCTKVIAVYGPSDKVSRFPEVYDGIPLM
jgi:hypothetical protein